MGRFLHRYLTALVHMPFRAVLAIFWLSGLLLGIGFSSRSYNILYDVVHSAVSADLSFAGCFLPAFLPFMITVLAMCSSKRFLLPLLVFVKAFLFAFTGSCCLNAFGISGWLIYCLVFFGDILILPVHWYVWLQAESYKVSAGLRSILFGIVGIFLISCIHYAVVAPFLADLLFF